ncbi:MAG: sugar transferase, partial [Proteobacteria bacterium]|nr:sugar transferase [Pseudomonadota bacterium]
CMERQRTLYGRGWDHYCTMRPGITGLWQVSGRNRLPYAKRVELDAYYVDNWSLWLDVRILLKTVKVVVTGDGSR